ncbi:MAG TPA: lipoprotein insertase outer membrane protein LolB [Rhodocyclaceae bacterium]|nr:lipoprotein insertase outer membrane protein LolB [Rhodocyclaceae bacterium]
MKKLLVFLLGLGLCGVAQADAGFSLSGRISIRQQDTAYHGTLSWQHSSAQDELVLAGPLGQGMAELRRDEHGVVLTLPDGAQHQADTLDALAGRLFGTPIPIAALPDWLRGIAPDASKDEKGRPARLVLPDWTVQWLRYGENGKPQLLLIEGGDVSVRLRVDSWEDVNAEAGK